MVGAGVAEHVEEDVGGAGPFRPSRPGAGAAGTGTQMNQPEAGIVAEKITCICQPVRNIKIFTL